MEAYPLTYIDTHVAVWLFDGELKSLSPAARTEIETADLLISPMALMEIRFLNEIGKIDAGPDAVLASLRKDIGLSICTLPFHRVVAAADNEDWTRDPFDRLIVAQAKANTAKLITRDRRIRKRYSRSLW